VSAEDSFEDRIARTRADAHLRMYEGALTSLTATVAYAHLLRDAAGTDPGQYSALDIPGREHVLAQGRAALLRAARVTRKAWDAMPAYGRERADVLLKGAARLGVETDWAGWKDGT
jgi:hypothetical protein